MTQERKTLTLKRPAPKTEAEASAADVIKTPASTGYRDGAQRQKDDC